MEQAVAADALGRDAVETHVDAPVRVAALAPYFVLGTLFGIVLTKGEAVSWFRIQEMFRFGAFHMYGIIASAVVVAAAAIAILRRSHRRALNGEEIALQPKTGFHRYWIGGSIFGVGWALTGACPGPLFVLVGGGVTVMVAAIASALAGTFVYGLVRRRLPH